MYEYCIWLYVRWIEITIPLCTYNYITRKKIRLIDGILLRLFFSLLSFQMYLGFKGFLLIRKEFLILYPNYTELIWHSGSKRVSYNIYLSLKEYFEMWRYNTLTITLSMFANRKRCEILYFPQLYYISSCWTINSHNILMQSYFYIFGEKNSNKVNCPRNC